MIATVFVLCCVVLLVLWYWERKQHFRLFKTLGIPGPEPNIIYGNVWDFQKDAIKAIRAWNQVYAKDRMFGFFCGRAPFLVSTDLKLAEKVLIKDFPNFMDRGDLLPLENVHPVLGKMLATQKNPEWKTMRNYMTPSFSTGKLKANLPKIEQGCKDLIQFLDSKCKEHDSTVDVMSVWHCFTLDNISRVVFGIESNSLNDRSENPVILQYALQGLKSVSNTNQDVVIKMFPGLVNLVKPIIGLLHFTGLLWHPFDNLANAALQIINFRKKKEIEVNDFMNSLLKAEAYATQDYDDLKVTDSDSKDPGAIYKGPPIAKMSPNAVVANAMMFFIAGFETTSTALSFLCIRLAQSQDIQDRLREEIFIAIKDNEGKITYEMAMNIRYLNNVINETLRMDPPVVAFTTRKALCDFEYNGRKFPAGLSVMFPTPLIQRDSDYFPDPDRFDPDRFSQERRGNIPSMAFQPFGDGPRNCIGMRVALTQIKVALCHVIPRYRLRAHDVSSDAAPNAVVLQKPVKTLIKVERI